MKWVLLTLILSLNSWAQNESLTQDIITDPNTSRRCKELLVSRSKQQKMRNRLSDLMQRNQNLLKENPDNKKTIEKKLLSLNRKIRNELYLSTLKLSGLEEKIIRSGCPGIRL